MTLTLPPPNGSRLLVYTWANRRPIQSPQPTLFSEGLFKNLPSPSSPPPTYPRSLLISSLSFYFVFFLSDFETTTIYLVLCKGHPKVWLQFVLFVPFTRGGHLVSVWKFKCTFPIMVWVRFGLKNCSRKFHTVLLCRLQSLNFNTNVEFIAGLCISLETQLGLSTGMS